MNSITSWKTLCAGLFLAALCSSLAATRDGYVLGQFSVFKNADSEKKFANTGLAYDTKRNILLIGNCYNNSVEFYDKTGKRVRPALDLSDLGLNGLQGVAYDTSDDTIWVWCGQKTPDGKKTRFMILHLDQDGNLIEEAFEFARSPGMISYDPNTDSLWADSYDWEDGYSLYRISCKTKKVEETLAAGPGIGYSEGVGYDPFDGTFWLLGREHIYHVRKNGVKYELIQKYPNPSENSPEDRAALDKIGRLKVVGSDWTFSVVSNGIGQISKPSGGLRGSSIQRKRDILVEGSEHNDGQYMVIALTHTNMTVRGRSGATVENEGPGREVAVSFFIGGADEGVAVDPTDHTIWVNTDVDKGANRIPGCNRCWHVDPLGVVKD